MIRLASFTCSAMRQSSSYFSERRADARKPLDALVEHGKTRVVCLPAPVAIKNLLQHDGEFEDGEHFIEGDVRQIKTSPRAVAFEQFGAREPTRAIGHRCHCIALRARCDVHPIAEQYAQIN